LVTSLPRVISNAGENAAFHSLEFITARIANPHTRAAYGRAIAEFCDWCEQQGLALPALSSPVVAAYFHELGTRLSASSTNQHLSAIRQGSGSHGTHDSAFI
jgi:site-specific recombinase XerD